MERRTTVIVLFLTWVRRRAALGLLIYGAISLLTGCGDRDERPVPLSMEGQRLGDAHLELIDALAAAARRHHDDCDALAGALDNVLAEHSALITAGSTRRRELETHYQEQAIQRMQRLLPYLYACAENRAVRVTVAAMQMGADR